MKNMKKVLVMTMAALLLVAVSVAGTVAYLTATSETVTNTFAATSVGVKVEEHDYDPTNPDADENGLTDAIIGAGQTQSDYKLIPGVELAKDPFVTVLANSEEVYVYVEVTKSTGFDTYVACEMAKGWTLVDGTNNVYYWQDKVSTLDGAPSDPIAVLKNNKVTVSKDITLETEFTAVPSIAFKPYVIQTATFADAVTAWTTVKGN